MVVSLEVTLAYLSGGYRSDWDCMSRCLKGGDAGGVSGFSAGEGPGGQTGKCLFGMGIGHAAELFMLSKAKVVVREGRGEEERCGGIGRGMAIVAIVGDEAKVCVEARATP